jgi:uncharacterized protein with HEPN domain
MCCEKILRFTRGMSREEILADDKTYDAVQRNLFVLGEAAKCVPNEIRQRHPDVAWRKIAGLRDSSLTFTLQSMTISSAT